MAEACEEISPSAPVTRVSRPPMALALPEIPASASVSPLSSALMAEACEEISPSALVTRVSRPPMALALPETPDAVSVSPLSRSLICSASAPSAVARAWLSCATVALVSSSAAPSRSRSEASAEIPSCTRVESSRSATATPCFAASSSEKRSQAPASCNSLNSSPSRTAESRNVRVSAAAVSPFSASDTRAIVSSSVSAVPAISPSAALRSACVWVRLCESASVS